MGLLKKMDNKVHLVIKDGSLSSMVSMGSRVSIIDNAILET